MGRVRAAGRGSAASAHRAPCARRRAGRARRCVVRRFRLPRLRARGTRSSSPELVLLDAPLPDHDWSEEVVAYAEEEERLLEAGDLDAATELNLSFWAPTVADRLRPMTRWSLELEVDEVEEVDLGAGARPHARGRGRARQGGLPCDSGAPRARAAGGGAGDHSRAPATCPSVERPEATAALVRALSPGLDWAHDACALVRAGASCSLSLSAFPQAHRRPSARRARRRWSSPSTGRQSRYTPLTS